MDEFNQNFNVQGTEPHENEQPKNNFEAVEPTVGINDNPFDNTPQDDQPVWNRVEYSPIEKINDYKPMGKGLKLFCAVMAAVILLTGTCAAGYFVGRSSVSNSYIGSSVDVDLAKKPTDADPNTPTSLYKMLNESVVGIRVYNEAGQQGDASGVIYSESGYIVTNDHIYSEIGAPKFKVFTHDGTEYDAVYVAGDTVSDLAVLKIKSDKKFKAAKFGNSDELVNGESVVAIGRPSDATDSSSITSGIISLTKRRVKTTSSYTARLIQTDSAINPGSSGGALVNAYGQVVGITSSKLSGVEYDAIGFAIPTKTMKRVVEQLIKDGKVTDRAKLGITYTEVNSVTAEVQKYASAGLLVVSVGEDSDIYGKVGEGDIITHVNGIPITNDEIVLDVIEDCKAGDTISLTVLMSKGNEVDFDVKLRANISESSYSATIRENEEEKEPSQKDEPSDKSNGGKFNFPYGE
ncbi:MAG: trypsin-like peptidase domain-containing protein [Clostridia bacterium]|nr:trypsin-like peptidase domain-containing protein [Clostridia bacterium]